MRYCVRRVTHEEWETHRLNFRGQSASSRSTPTGCRCFFPEAAIAYKQSSGDATAEAGAMPAPTSSDDQGAAADILGATGIREVGTPYWP